MPIDRGFVNNTNEGIWDVHGNWDDDLTTWSAALPVVGNPLVPRWDAGQWDDPQAIWGPEQFAGTSARFDPYDGAGYWDSGQCWDTDFWLTWA